MSSQLKMDLKSVASKLTLLYIEDDNDTRAIFEKLLKPYFKSIKSFDNAICALDEYKQKSYDLVITDIAMPQMDGLELIDKIREINNFQYIVVCSTYDQPILLIELLNAGVDGFIIKPVNTINALKNLFRICTRIQESKITSSLKDRQF